MFLASSITIGTYGDGNTYYTPFSYQGPGSSTENGQQGIKIFPGRPREFVLTGTSGNISSSGQGTVYVGPFNNRSTSQGSGSGSWTLFNVPSSWNAASSTIYGPGNITLGNGTSGIESIQLAGTYTVPVMVGTTSSYQTIGHTYEGPLTSNQNDSNYTSFAAKTPTGGEVYDTFLHSYSGGLVAGNYTLSNTILALTLNTSHNSNAFIYNPQTGSQVDITYNTGSLSNTAFGIWYNGPSRFNNNNDTYTFAGGSSLINPAVKVLGKVGQQIGIANVADYDPITGKTFNHQGYQYLNDTRNAYVTHFEGINKIGTDIYQLPFTATSNEGSFAGNAYIKRQPDGRFSQNAVWQTFNAGSSGTLLSNDSVAGFGSAGIIDASGAFDPWVATMNNNTFRSVVRAAQQLL